MGKVLPSGRHAFVGVICYAFMVNAAVGLGFLKDVPYE